MTPCRAPGSASFFWLLLIWGAATSVAQEQVMESPLKKAKAGDWVELKADVSGVEILGKRSNTTATIRYTVKDKTESEAILLVKSWSGALETGEYELKIPLDKPVDVATFVPTSDDADLKLVETFQDKKYKIKQKEFAGTGYKYKMSIDLFGKLLPENSKDDGIGKPKEKGKGMEMTIAIFLSPEAPVLGIVAMGMNGIQAVKYELYDGTGVSPLLYPPPPTRAELAKVGDWLEYRGTNKVDGREVVLRHTVVAKEMQKVPGNKDGKEEEAIHISAKLSVDGTETETWQFVVPAHDALAEVPHWGDWGFTGEHSSVRKGREGRQTRMCVLGDTWIEARTADSQRIGVTIDGNKQLVDFQKSTHYQIPLTGAAAFRLARKDVVDIRLDLADHSGCATITKTVPAPQTQEEKEAKQKSKINSKNKSDEEADEPKVKIKPGTKPKPKPKSSKSK